MSRVYNFSAGPAVLPEEVLKEAAAEMMDYNGTGMSVMEMSHRSKAFEEIITAAEQDLRDLMNIPDNYKVLFLQGGASQQFAMIPMNLMKNKEADYIVTGQWAKKAAPLSSSTRRQASASRNTADRDTASVRSGAVGRRGDCTALHWRTLTAAMRNIWTRRRKSRRTSSGTSAPTD